MNCKKAKFFKSPKQFLLTLAPNLCVEVRTLENCRTDEVCDATVCAKVFENTKCGLMRESTLTNLANLAILLT